MDLNFFKSDGRKIEEFCEGRSHQPDDDFIIDCDLPDDPDAIRVALAVRRAVGRVGYIDPTYIRADDRYPEELLVLPRWDSLDVLDFFFTLEDELDTKLSNLEAQKIKVVGYCVRQFAHDALEVVVQRRTV